MSDLREKVYQYLDDNDWGWRRDGVDEIISMVLDSESQGIRDKALDEAIEAVNKQNRYVYDNKLINRIDVIKAIEKLKEKE